MTAQTEHLYVKSHVSRDLLQSAALFKTDHLVVWEYASNGLQYVDPGVTATVRVRLDHKNKRITIKDNGRGMTFADLQNFFVMHGDNLERRAGRAGRGMFGTGKSAAFGIAEELVVTTVRNGHRTKVSLDRTDIEQMTDDSPIPVKVLEREVPTTAANGTLIEIERIHLRKLDQKRVVNYVERHLAHWPRGVTVWINNHECQYTPPAAIRTETIPATGPLAKKLGECTLVLHVAASPLSEDERGVSIFSKGVWHETTLAGSEGRDMSAFIFGEIDVPLLDEDTSPIAPFDMSRSLKLNPANELVRAITAFVGAEVEKLRKELVAQERQRKASEDAKRLAKQADEIAQMLNADFADFRQRLARTRAKAHGGEDAGPSEPTGPARGDDFLFGDEVPAEPIPNSEDIGERGNGQGGNGGSPRKDVPAVQPADDNAPKKGKNGGDGSTRQKPRGGFSIDFRNMGEDEHRAKYHRDDRQIVLNLDHPQFKAALGAGSLEDISFRRLAYEVAFSEYALALALELAQRDEYMDVTDPIVDIGETINRVARRAASLYQTNQ